MTKKTLINKNFEDQYLMTSQRVFSHYKVIFTVPESAICGELI